MPVTSPSVSNRASPGTVRPLSASDNTQGGVMDADTISRDPRSRQGPRIHYPYRSPHQIPT